MDAVESEKDTTPKVRQGMFVDTHTLYKTLPWLRSRITELNGIPEKESELATLKSLYELLHEMYSKLNKSRSVRLDYW